MTAISNAAKRIPASAQSVDNRKLWPAASRQRQDSQPRHPPWTGALDEGPGRITTTGGTDPPPKNFSLRLLVTRARCLPSQVSKWPPSLGGARRPAWDKLTGSLEKQTRGYDHRWPDPPPSLPVLALRRLFKKLVYAARSPMGADVDGEWPPHHAGPPDADADAPTMPVPPRPTAGQATVRDALAFSPAASAGRLNSQHISCRNLKTRLRCKRFCFTRPSQ